MTNNLFNENLAVVDPAIADAINNETKRQSNGLELIASENFVSEAVLQAAGSVFTNKYAEGYPGKRYYGGCEFADVVENTAIERAKQIFGAEHANVQPHSGAQANMTVLLAALEHGDTILGMNLSHGGHLTHGHPLNFSGLNYTVADYGVNKETEQIDYDELQKIAEIQKPKLLICGASAYPRTIDFARISEIARSVNARVMADIAHIAGLVAVGLHPSPVPHCEYVTTTTHKTLRGPRGGLIMPQMPRRICELRRTLIAVCFRACRADRWFILLPPKPSRSAKLCAKISKPISSRFWIMPKRWRKLCKRKVCESFPAARTII